MESTTNKILKSGDWVKYKRKSSLLDHRGFKLGHSYMVQNGINGLEVMADQEYGAVLVWETGELTNSADYFSLVQSSSLLPNGILLNNSSLKGVK